MPYLTHPTLCYVILLTALIGGPYTADEPFVFDLSYYSQSLSSSSPLSHPHADKGSALSESDKGPHTPTSSIILIKEKHSSSVEEGVIGGKQAVVRTLEQEKEQVKVIWKNARDPSAISTAAAGAVGAGEATVEVLTSHSRVTAVITPANDVTVAGVAEFERTGLRNRDGDRDRDTGKQGIAIGPVEFIKPDSSAAVDTISRETGAVGKGLCGIMWMCTFRLLSSTLANSTFREAQEKDRDRWRDGAGPATTPSVLSMAGEWQATHITLCHTVYHTVLYCPILYSLYYTILFCTVLYCTVLYCTVLYCTVLYCTVLYSTVLHCTVLYYSVLYYTILYCTVLFCTVLYCTVTYGRPGTRSCKEKKREGRRSSHELRVSHFKNH